ncbi:hypothetical protein UB33_05725 [Photobacterium angustum]|uniref:AAA family ATPase n=1 Tax=Photobacterium angustum TaxID=661 RepID=UPI0005E26ECD|nr:AAA family ATPase [Photobacterium angustum]KJF93403.1 hypothetical protein UB39_15990 [Photobacterium angustum]KJG07184.1 hypothetical protein UB33_05725 [Photobacterium angustum]PSV90401.1 hypothetical protein CTN01_15865 [Photobacterium angustum]PSW83190.1 hypothetical protein CTN03_01755 [Photobacterium angustum]
MIIKNLKVEEGFFNNLDLDFSTGLNVLVGGRGVGKTSIIELLRFGLGATSLSGEGASSSATHALSILQSSGRVTIELELPSGEEISISKSAQENTPLVGASYVPPIIFSQKEIETVGVSKAGRLALIDSFLPDVENTKELIKQSNFVLRSLCANYHSAKQELTDLIEKTSDEKNLKERELSLQKMHEDHQKANKRLLKSEGNISRVQQKLATISVNIQNLLTVKESVVRRVSTLNSIFTFDDSDFSSLLLDFDKPLYSSLISRREQDEMMLQAILDNNKSSLKEIDDHLSLLQLQKTELEKEARKTRAEVDSFTEGAGAMLSELGRVREQLAQVANYTHIANQKSAQVNDLYNQIQDQLLKTYELKDAIYKSRLDVVQHLNTNLQPNVTVVCRQQTNLSEYSSNLEAALRGSGLKYKELLEKITNNVSPQWLLYYTAANKFEEFSSALNIPVDRAARLLGHLSEIDLGLVLSSNIEDVVDCMLLDHGKYKSIGELSIGQRCTVALSIILENKNRVLVIDQPEDHLDNEFIVNTLIKAIRQRADLAQTILSSHNANIPVLGNASRVINLDSNGRKGFVKTFGGINEAAVKNSIESIMEGGKEAFQHRSTFYSS